MSDSPLDSQRAANLAENPHAGQGMVTLDIGDDVGAIVLHLPASLEGVEVEIESDDGAVGVPTGDDHPHPHPHEHPHSHSHEHHGHDRDNDAHGHDHPHRPHVAVVGRPIGDHLDYSAVFPALTQGRYALFVPGSTAPVRVEVRGGEVNEIVWPDDNPST